MMQVGLSEVTCWQSEGPSVIEYASQGSYPTSLKKKKKNARICQYIVSQIIYVKM